MRCGSSTALAEQHAPLQMPQPSAECRESTWYLKGCSGISYGFKEFSVLHLLLFCFPPLSAADGINTACVGCSSLAQREPCGIGL